MALEPFTNADTVSSSLLLSLYMGGQQPADGRVFPSNNSGCHHASENIFEYGKINNQINQ